MSETALWHSQAQMSVVKRAELRRLVWPDMAVGGTTLARLVNEIRAAVGDAAARGGVVRTVPRVGYRSARKRSKRRAQPPGPAARCSGASVTSRWRRART